MRRSRGAADDGSPVDILRPIAATSASPGRVRSDFARAHAAIRDAADPALIEVFAVIEHREAVEVVRAPLEDGTLADVEGVLSGPTVAAIGARLAPAILEVGAALGGAVLPVDVGLDERGWVVLAPLGPHTSAVERSVAGAAAPEIAAGAAPDGRAALFSLGALLYRLATGRVPATGTEPVPPSTWNHRVSPELDRAILRLLSSEPSERALALPDLQAAAGPPQDLRPAARSLSKPTATRAASRRSSGGVPLTLSNGSLAVLDPRGKSIAAGLAGVPLAAVDELARAGLPLVIARTTAQDRSREQARVQALLGVDAEVSTRASLPPLVWVLLGLVGAGLPLAIGLVLLPWLGIFAALPALVLSLAVAAFTGWRALSSRGVRSEASSAETAWEIQERGRQERGQWPQVAAVDRRISRIRQDLAHADLPPNADADVRDALKELEQRLSGILGVLQTAERALGSVDRTRLSARLQTLEQSVDPSHRPARDKAARTAADLAEVEARRDRQLAEVHGIEGALDELAAALVHPEDAQAAPEVDRVARTAQLLRQRGIDQ